MDYESDDDSTNIRTIGSQVPNTTTMVERRAQNLRSLISSAEAVSESLRDLEFYTPETACVTPVEDAIRFLTGTASDPPVEPMQRFMRTRIVPLLSSFMTAMTFQNIRDSLRRIVSSVGRRRIGQRHEHRVDPEVARYIRTIQRSDIARRAIRVERSVRTYVSENEDRSHGTDHIISMADAMYHGLQTYLSIAEAVLVQHQYINSVEDRKMFAIVIIGTLREAGFLGEEYDWAQFRE